MILSFSKFQKVLGATEGFDTSDVLDAAGGILKKIPREELRDLLNDARALIIHRLRDKGFSDDSDDMIMALQQVGAFEREAKSWFDAVDRDNEDPLYRRELLINLTQDDLVKVLEKCGMQVFHSIKPKERGGMLYVADGAYDVENILYAKVILLVSPHTARIYTQSQRAKSLVNSYLERANRIN